jgi:integrase
MLTDTAIKNAKPADKPRKLADEKGLYLLLNPGGGKLWRLKYRFEGKEKLLALGAYPAITLKDARDRRDEAKKLLANGVDPGAVKKAQKTAKQERSANTFEAVANRWLLVWKTGVEENTARRVWRSLELHIFPCIGALPVADVKPKAVLGALRNMEDKGLGNSVEKAKNAISQIMRFAVREELAEVDPVPSLKGSLKTIPERHYPAITDPVRFAQLLRDVDGYSESKGAEVRAALRLLALCFTRPGEMVAARWADIDLDKAEWKYFASKTKTNHLVSLSRQAVAILEELRAKQQLEIRLRDCPLVFPGKGSKGISRPISNDNTLNNALRAMGYDTQDEHAPNGHCAHGFRASARTMLAEQLEYPPEVIEHQLAHKVPDALGTAYNRTKYLKKRREMVQAWADYLDKLKAGADVIPLRGNAA